jgi:hypothetical protein
LFFNIYYVKKTKQNMATKNIYVHLDHHGQEIQNVSLEKLTTVAIAALAGADLYDGRIVYDTDKNQMVTYNGTVWQAIANSSDLNKFGAQIGALDATGGFPDGTTAGQIGSGVDELDVPLTTVASIQTGDTWIITTAGIIAGIAGNDTLDVGDLLMATADGAAVAADFVGIQMNVNDLNLGINNWAATTVYEANAIVTASSPTTGHQTIYRRIGAGTSAATFTAVEEALHLTLATAGKIEAHADDTTVAPSIAGNPTITEIETYVALAGTVHADGLLYYTGDDLPASTPTYVYWIDSAGSAVKLSGGESGILAVTKTAPLVAATPLSFAAEMAAVIPAMTTIRSIQVIEVATGEDITSGVRIDWTAFEVESNVAIASVTITILGEA